MDEFSNRSRGKDCLEIATRGGGLDPCGNREFAGPCEGSWQAHKVTRAVEAKCLTYLARGIGCVTLDRSVLPANAVVRITISRPVIHQARRQRTGTPAGTTPVVIGDSQIDRVIILRCYRGVVVQVLMVN